MKVKLSVKRTNPETGQSGYSKYEIDAAENVTLLDALIQVREGLDRAYLDKWIKALGLEDEWRAALALAKPEPS